MDSKHYVDRYYLTDVDAFADSIYCHHAMMGEKVIQQHSHKKGQFLYTEGGMVFLRTGEKSYYLPARHYIWIPGGVEHSIHPSSPEVIMRNLYFPRFDIDTDFYDKINIYPVNDLLIELIMFTNRWNGNIFPTEESKFSIAKAFKLILPELSPTELPLALPYPKHALLKEVVAHLEKVMGDNPHIKSVAAHFGISERTLSRLFQNELNMTFIQYYTQLRMLTALKLLLDSEMSIREVAIHVGYSSLPTFSNTFNKIIGVRPTTYIKNKYLLL